MELLHSSPFIDIEFDNSMKFFRLTWKEATRGMSKEQFKQEMKVFIEALSRKALHALHRMQEMYFVVTPDIQEWVDENINKQVLKYGAPKAAFLVSSNIFSQVSVEQTMDEEHAKKITTAYFDNEDEAMKWLFK